MIVLLDTKDNLLIAGLKEDSSVLSTQMLMNLTSLNCKWSITFEIQQPRNVASTLLNYEPFVVAIYDEKLKPEEAHEYLAEFLFQINQLLETGVEISRRQFQVKNHCFIKDTYAGEHACE